MQSINLTHHFLIAMPAMEDPSFSKTLTYICEHNEQGALGLVVNRPTDLMLESMFNELGIPLITLPSEAYPYYLADQYSLTAVSYCINQLMAGNPPWP